MHDKSNDSALAPKVIFKFAEDGSIYEPDISSVKENEKADKESSKTKKLSTALAKIFNDKNDGIGYRELARLLTKEYNYKGDKSGISKSAKDRIDDGIGEGIICKHDDEKYYLKS